MKLVKRIKNNKLLYVLSILIIGLLLTLIVRITFAFLAPRINSAANNVSINSDLIDEFKFSIGNPLVINATSTTLPENGANLVSTTKATASLKANSTNNSATYNYYVYFEISDNTFIYTNGTTPEIILTITDPNGNAVTNIDGLTYGTYSGVSGFDVTTQNGVFTVASLYEIVSNSSTTATIQEWNFTLTYLNLSFDQSSNYGNSMTTEVMIQKDKIKPILASYIISQYTTQGANGLYLHDSTLANSANDGSYRYAGGDYQLTETATSEGYTTLITSSSSETGGLIDFYCNGSKEYVGYLCSTSYTYYYTVAGSGSYTTYQSALDAGVSQGYLTGDNVKNFVCFGSNTETCPTDNLYRIIGVFDNQVKLIKYDYAGTDLLGTDGDRSRAVEYDYYSGKRDLTTSQYMYYWNKANYSATKSATGYYNVWSYSALNTVNLNTNYINNIGGDWASKIATTTWKVGGATRANVSSSPVTTAYQNEIVNPNADVETEYSAKIGLMYASDYGYATSPENWTTNLGSYSRVALKSTNWMYMGDYEWTISRRSDGTFDVFYVHREGYVTDYDVESNAVSVRPSFNLESTVVLTGGTGTASDPYRIS